MAGEQPGPPDTDARLDVEWQDRILRRLLQAGALLGTPVALFALSQQPLAEADSMWWVLLGACAVFASLAVVRQHFSSLRAWVALPSLGSSSAHRGL